LARRKQAEETQSEPLNLSERTNQNHECDETGGQSSGGHGGFQGNRRGHREATGLGGRGRGGELFLQANLAKKADIDQLFAEAQKAFGRVDILINNAGIYEFSPIEEISEAHFHKQFDLNVLGLLLASQAAVRQFGPTGGVIVNISSVVATMGVPNAAAYSGTKGAVDAITRALAKELGPRKIRVNAINPGMVETEGVHTAGIADSDFRKQIEAATPLGRIGQPGDIAGAALFLVSEEASWITGQTLTISGGYQ
jgi:3-oxoacyl-[acyl-carrier protein] reductase